MPSWRRPPVTPLSMPKPLDPRDGYFPHDFHLPFPTGLGLSHGGVWVWISTPLSYTNLLNPTAPGDCKDYPGRRLHCTGAGAEGQREAEKLQDGYQRGVRRGLGGGPGPRSKKEGGGSAGWTQGWGGVAGREGPLPGSWGLCVVAAMAGRAELQEGHGVQIARFPATEH